MTKLLGTEAEITARIEMTIKMEIKAATKVQENLSRQSSKPPTKAILKFNPAKPIKHSLKILFTNDSNTIEEVIKTFQDGDPLKPHGNLIAYVMLRGKCKLFEDGKWKKLCTMMCRVLTSLCNDEWKEEVSAIRNL